MRRNYYGDRSLNGLRATAEVILHESDETLVSTSLVRAAQDVDIIVADRMTEGRGEIFVQLRRLGAFVRSAVARRPRRRRQPQRGWRGRLEGRRARAPGRAWLRASRCRARARLHGRSL